MRKIDKVIIHCSATPEGRDVKMETIRDWHLKRGWSDIGYHYVIELDGKIVPARPLERVGAHCRGREYRQYWYLLCGRSGSGYESKRYENRCSEICASQPTI